MPWWNRRDEEHDTPQPSETCSDRLRLFEHYCDIENVVLYGSPTAGTEPLLLVWLGRTSLLATAYALAVLYRILWRRSRYGIRQNPGLQLPLSISTNCFLNAPI